MRTNPTGQLTSSGPLSTLHRHNSGSQVNHAASTLPPDNKGLVLPETPDRDVTVQQHCGILTFDDEPKMFTKTTPHVHLVAPKPLLPSVSLLLLLVVVFTQVKDA